MGRDERKCTIMCLLDLSWITSYLHYGEKSHLNKEDTIPPVGHIFKKHGIDYLIYADDAQPWRTIAIVHKCHYEDKNKRCDLF